MAPPLDAQNAKVLIVRERPVVLEAEDIHLTDTARRKAKLRRLFRLFGFIAAPLLIAQALAFGSFIFEEALQAASFGARSALLSQDPALAYAAVRNFETVMRKAQRWQDTWGCMAFWTHGAFREYFYLSAPTQLLGFYAEGKRLSLWGEHPARWVQEPSVDGFDHWVDTWQRNPTKKLLDLGFDPELFYEREKRREELARHNQVLPPADSVCDERDTVVLLRW